MKLIGLLGICLVLSTALSAQETDSDAARIKEAYKKITDIKGTFTQKSHIKDLKRTETYKGDFIIKIPSKMRWRYKGDNPQEIIINNEKDGMIIYQKKEKQAFRTKFDRASYGQAPVALLSGLGDIAEEFYISKKGKSLLLRPKVSMGNVTEIELLPSDEGFPIKSLTVIDKYSNTVTIILEKVEMNTGLKDSDFKFALPEGVSLYEHNP